MSKTIRILIGGMGNAALPVVELAASQNPRLLRSYGFTFTIAGAADSRGAAWCDGGIDPEAILAARRSAGTVAAVAGLGHPGATALDMIHACEADIYIEALPPFLPTGEPGAANLRAALRRGMHAVTANKAPLALYWGELFALAEQAGLRLRCGAAAGAGLPTLELGRALGDSGELLEFAGIFNTSCTYVLQSMREGRSFEEAIQGARAGGFLDPDWSCDIDGWDAAMKTLIQSNLYFRAANTLADVEVRGIRGLTREDMAAAGARGEVWCMVGRAVRTEEGARLSAGPECLPKGHPLASARWRDKAIWMRTRTQGEQVHFGMGASGSATPGSLFADAVRIARELV